MAAVKMVKQFTRDEIAEIDDPEEVTRLFDAGCCNEALGRPVPKATDSTPSDLVEEVDDTEGDKKKGENLNGDRKVQGVNT